MIVVLGRQNDGPASDIARRLASVGADVALVNPHQAQGMSLTVSPSGWKHSTLQLAQRTIRLDQVSSMYVRCSSHTADGPEAAALVARAMWVADHIPCRVVNRPTAMASNASKPWQARQLRALGLPPPPTLVTTNPADVETFAAVYGALVYKSVSGVRSVVQRADVRDRSRLASITACPTQFQQLVRGVNHRVHVVGARVFAAAVHSSTLDYRYPSGDGQGTSMRSVDLPPWLINRCRRASQAMGLPVCGVDLIRRHDGRWFCLEMNPSPAYTWFARLTGAPIGDAIATFLAQPNLAAHTAREEGRIRS